MCDYSHSGALSLWLFTFSLKKEVNSFNDKTYEAYVDLCLGAAIMKDQTC